MKVPTRAPAPVAPKAPWSCSHCGGHPFARRRTSQQRACQWCGLSRLFRALRLDEERAHLNAVRRAIKETKARGEWWLVLLVIAALM